VFPNRPITLHELCVKSEVLSSGFKRVTGFEVLTAETTRRGMQHFLRVAVRLAAEV
jgi:hypothetical protein